MTRLITFVRCGDRDVAAGNGDVVIAVDAVRNTGAGLRLHSADGELAFGGADAAALAVDIEMTVVFGLIIVLVGVNAILVAIGGHHGAVGKDDVDVTVGLEGRVSPAGEDFIVKCALGDVPSLGASLAQSILRAVEDVGQRSVVIARAAGVVKVIVQHSVLIYVGDSHRRHPEFRLRSVASAHQLRVDARHKRTITLIGEDLVRVDGLTLFIMPGGVSDMRTVAARQLAELVLVVTNGYFLRRHRADVVSKSYHVVLIEKDAYSSRAQLERRPALESSRAAGGKDTTAFAAGRLNGHAARNAHYRRIQDRIALIARVCNVPAPAGVDDVKKSTIFHMDGPRKTAADFMPAQVEREMLVTGLEREVCGVHGHIGGERHRGVDGQFAHGGSQIPRIVIACTHCGQRGSLHQGQRAAGGYPNLAAGEGQRIGAGDGKEREKFARRNHLPCLSIPCLVAHPLPVAGGELEEMVIVAGTDRDLMIVRQPEVVADADRDEGFDIDVYGSIELRRAVNHERAIGAFVMDAIAVGSLERRRAVDRERASVMDGTVFARDAAALDGHCAAMVIDARAATALGIHDGAAAAAVADSQAIALIDLNDTTFTARQCFAVQVDDDRMIRRAVTHGEISSVVDVHVALQLNHGVGSIREFVDTLLDAAFIAFTIAYEDLRLILRLQRGAQRGREQTCGRKDHTPYSLR